MSGQPHAPVAYHCPPPPQKKPLAPMCRMLGAPTSSPPLPQMHDRNLMHLPVYETCIVQGSLVTILSMLYGHPCLPSTLQKGTTITVSSVTVQTGYGLHSSGMFSSVNRYWCLMTACRYHLQGSRCPRRKSQNIEDLKYNRDNLKSRINRLCLYSCEVRGQHTAKTAIYFKQITTVNYIFRWP